MSHDRRLLRSSLGMGGSVGGFLEAIVLSASVGASRCRQAGQVFHYGIK